MSYFTRQKEYQNKTEFDSNNKVDTFKKPRPKAVGLEPIKAFGFKKMGTTPTPEIIKKPEITPPKGEGMGVDDGLSIASGAVDLLTNNKPEIDTSGNTSYDGVSASDVGGGAMDIASSTMDFATKGAAIGGPLGAAVGGVVGFGKGLIEGGKQTKLINQAKQRSLTKKRIASENTIDEISNQNKEEEIFGPDSKDYVDNLRNSSAYNRFKRNTKYN
tara:strand:+ start:8782 stop:9429 length:648 start_codon:yes stop_codon:yes gene_type:complete